MPDDISGADGVVDFISEYSVKYGLQAFFHRLVFEAPGIQLTGDELNKSGDEDLEPSCFIVDTFRKLIVRANCTLCAITPIVLA